MVEKLTTLYKKIGIAYVRTSGIVNPKTSIPNQINEITKYCERNNIILKYILVDEAETGRYTENRDKYQQLKRIVKSEHIDMIIVSFADRFARDSFEYILSIRELVKNGRQFIALYEGVVEECTSALELSMTAIKVELENEQRTKRLADGKKTSLESGRFQATPPYGYKKDKELRLIANIEEAKVIQKLFEMYITGHKVAHISRELNQNPLYEEQPHIYSSKLWNYLKNKTFTGYVYKKQQVDHEDGSFHVEYIQESKVPHEIIVSEEVFEMARSKWDKNHKRITRSFYLCSTLMKCPCGKNITGSYEKNHYFAYEPKNRKEACCRFVLNEVDERLLSFLSDLDQNKPTTSNDHIKDLYIQIEQSLKDNEIKFALGKISKTTFMKNVEAINRKFADLEENKNKITNDNIHITYANMILEEDYKGLKRRLKKEKFTFTIDSKGIKILTWEVPI